LLVIGLDGTFEVIVEVGLADDDDGIAWEIGEVDGHG